MRYVDGYLLKVPVKKLNAYKKMAREAGKIWKKYGALEYVECAGDDMNMPHPEMGGVPFTKLMKAKNEIVFFSFVVYKSKKQRDAVNKKVNAYMEKKYADYKGEEMPFDMKNFSSGGFNAIVDL